MTHHDLTPEPRGHTPPHHDLWRIWDGQDALSITCPDCHAIPDEWCVTGRGNIHTNRIYSLLAPLAAVA